MNIELVTIGTELLLGFTVDTNGAEIGRMLADIGVRVARRTAIADRPDDIRAAVADALARTGGVIVTGGLGPTRDDITKHTVARLFDAPIVFDDGLWAALVERYRRAGRVPVESNRTQAEVPAGATVLPNRWGSAPGLWLERPDTGFVIMLPGVPLEMRNLMRHEVVPRLRERSSGRVIRSMTLRTVGVAEAALAEQLGEVERDIAPVTLAYLPQAAGVDLRLTIWDVADHEAEALLARAADRVRRDAGRAVYGVGNDDLAGVVLAAARDRGISLALAESCTGGLVGARLTDIPGSSDVLLGAAVCYSYASKTAVLGVPADIIVEQGAVSEAVARRMAEGVLRRFDGRLSVAVTGIAGPDGGTPDKPVGTVWFATAMDGDVRASRTVFFGTRAEVRERAAQTALRLLLERLQQVPLP
jgi:nicotinamide-nucleotide amidase